MSETKSRMGTAVAGILAAGAMIAGTMAQAAVPGVPASWEKCAGVAKTGMNDCGALNGKHDCAGKASMDNDIPELSVLLDEANRARRICDQVRAAA